MSVITYAYPVVGSTAPTLAQMQNYNLLAGTVQMGDTDTVAVIVHSFGNLSASQAQGTPNGSTESTSFFPIPSVVAEAYGTATSTVSQQFAWAWTSSVSMTLTKVSAGNTGGTFVFQIGRPVSIER